MLFFNIIVMSHMGISKAIEDDYWSNDFDSSKNCKSGEEVTELQKGASQCYSQPIKEDGDEAAFLRCVKVMNQKLLKTCGDSDVKDPGKLLYCKNRGLIQCCFKDHQCDTWASINNPASNPAKDFLGNISGFLDHQVKNMGYRTCHHLTSLDATKCAEDCEQQKKGKFAKQCQEKGGLFKCCIRRDHQHCDTCRFCCTLPMCSVAPGGKEGTSFDNHHLDLKDQDNKKTAIKNYYSTLHRWKTDDYYCLKPYSNKDPEKWEQYNMEEFRKAFTKEALANVKTYKFDIRLNNLVDPKVLKMFTKKEKKSYKSWMGAYFLRMKRMPSFFDINKGKKVYSIKLDNSIFRYLYNIRR